MNEDLEKKLVSACREGDKSAYAKLAKHYSGRIFAICLGMLRHRENAEDIAQQALLKALTNIKQLRDDEHFGAWIARIAKNLCIDFTRKQKWFFLIKRAAVSRNSSKEYPELEDALAKLPQDSRLVLMLYYFDGRSTKNIAETFETSEAAVQTRISRARKQLREILDTEGDE